jgi:hypothetical protein
MVYINWKQPKLKINSSKKKKLGRNQKYKDEMKSAFEDEKELKRKKKRLSFDWFFRPQGD